jgi:glycosyltransferase involved in cell wall biosynthesis
MLDTWTPSDGLPTLGRPSGLTQVGRGEPASPRRRSVCLYTPSVDPSGMGAHMLDLAAEWVRDHDVCVMAWPTAPGQRLLDRAAAVGARVVALRHPRDPRFAEGVVDALREHPVDVFHVHVGTGRENFDGARAARRAGVPAVVQTQHLPWLLASRKHRAPFFRALQPVDHLITVSHAQRQTYERIGVAPELMTTVPNGIRARGPGAGRDAARVALGLDGDQPVVLTVGRLTVMKGQRHLLDAVPELARRFGGVAVVVIGQGHLHAQLRSQAEALGVADRVHLVGHRADARMLLDAADVFVLPSRHEGMPLVLLEAMDAGLPVVATRVIGSEEVVVDGETGLLVRPQDPAALAAALGRLLEDPALRQRYGRAGRRRYLERFTSVRMAAQTAEVYDHVLRALPVAVASGG